MIMLRLSIFWIKNSIVRLEVFIFFPAAITFYPLIRWLCHPTVLFFLTILMALSSNSYSNTSLPLLDYMHPEANTSVPLLDYLNRICLLCLDLQMSRATQIQPTKQHWRKEIHWGRTKKCSCNPLDYNIIQLSNLQHIGPKVRFQEWTSYSLKLPIRRTDLRKEASLYNFKVVIIVNIQR